MERIRLVAGVAEAVISPPVGAPLLGPASPATGIHDQLYARALVLSGGVPSQASSWSKGAFHGIDAYRPLVFGGTPLLQNGDFEDTVKAPEDMKKAGWQFADDLAPARWSFTQSGTAAVVAGGAASGQRFYRGRGCIFQFIALPANFRGNVRVRLKARGTGSLWVATFQYQRQPYKCLETVVAKDVKLDTRDWTPVEASQALSDDRLLALALHLEGEVDLDDVSVTAEAAPHSRTRNLGSEKMTP